MKITDMSDKLNNLNNEIKRILSVSGYEDYNDLSNVDYDNSSSEELLLMDEYNKIVEKLSDVNDTLVYLKRPIEYTGRLYKDSRGRYSIDNYTWTSGSTIEFLCKDDWHDREVDGEWVNTPYWAISRMEHNGQDYYIVHYNDMALDGLEVRVRG
ncbi:DUF5348 domain-containing protein [Lachnoclostridium pacaense]|uniref:DUF5348 domain-containing protein n=1 Tax=Enterocloster hominis (ex Hitch et al. 2024) TaxID=1917870 RepID=UPI001D1249E9|nr:DUF5348 domain-containing protein [Lachnoclostridium pacaense]MCC2821034.1 DUF5348 domain-containing protein [Lachnoclostridium pacaense]